MNGYPTVLSSDVLSSRHVRWCGSSNRGSAPAILLRESYREGGKVKNRTLANLSRWPAPKIDALSRVLKGQPRQVELAQGFAMMRSLPHGHVAAVLGIARALGVEQMIDPTPSRLA